eukprot:scaffold92508_cov17-Tisochrysis_lutea.AAC.1
MSCDTDGPSRQLAGQSEPSALYRELRPALGGKAARGKQVEGDTGAEFLEWTQLRKQHAARDLISCAQTAESDIQQALASAAWRPGCGSGKNALMLEAKREMITPTTTELLMRVQEACLRLSIDDIQLF